MPVPSKPSDRSEPPPEATNRQQRPRDPAAQPAQQPQLPAPLPFRHQGLSTLVEFHSRLLQLLTEQLQYLQLTTEYNYRLLHDRVDSIGAQQQRASVPDIAAAVRDLQLAQPRRSPPQDDPDNNSSPPVRSRHCQCPNCLQN